MSSLDLAAILASGPLLGAFVAALVEVLKRFLPLGGPRTMAANFCLCLAFPVCAHLLSWDKAGSSWDTVADVALSAAVFGTGSWSILRGLIGTPGPLPDKTLLNTPHPTTSLSPLPPARPSSPSLPGHRSNKA